MTKETNYEMIKIGVLVAVVAVALPEMSFAASFKGITDKVAKEEAVAIPYLVNVVGYVIGTVLMLSGALSLKKHSENPASEPLGKGLGRLLVGAAVTAIPSVLGMMQETSKLAGTTNENMQNFTTGF